MKTRAKTRLGANTVKGDDKPAPKAKTTKPKGSRLHLLLQPEEEPLIVSKVIRQYTRKKKVESADSVNKLAGTNSINVAAALSHQNNSILLFNNHVKIKQEIMESFHDIEIMDVDVEIENHIKTEKKSESQNKVGAGENYVIIKEENIVPNASYNSDQNCEYGKTNNHVEIKENVAGHKGTLTDNNLHQINTNKKRDTVQIKEESIDTLLDESVMNNDASMNSNLSEIMLETPKITIKIEPEDDSQYMNSEQKHIDGFPRDCAQSEEDIAVEVKPKVEKINCNNVNGKMDSRYSENEDVEGQNYEELAPILKLQQTLNVANVQAPQKKILITEEIHIKEEAISDTEDCVEVKDKTSVTTSSIQVKDKTPVTTSSIKVKHNTPVTTSSIQVKDKTPKTAGSNELKDKTPVTTSSINVKHKAPVTTRSIEVRHNTPITASSIQVKDKTPITASSIELKDKTPITTSSIELKDKTAVTSSSIQANDKTSISASSIDLKDKTPVTTSSIEVKHKTPVTTSSMELKYKTPVATSSIEVKHKTPVTTSSIEVKDKTPEATSSIEVKDNSPVVIKKNPLPENIKIRRIMNMPKILKTYGRKQPDPVAMKKCFLLAVSTPPAKILKIVSQKLPKIKSNPKFICDMCRSNFRSKVSMSAHMRFTHGVVMKHSCEVCSASFPHHYLMLAHWRAHAGPPLVCDLCPKSFRSKDKYGEHLNTHLRERLYPCPVCLQRYPVLLHLHRHAEKHTQEDTLSCNICKESYRSLIDLRRHSERDHGEKEEFPCYVCSRILSSSADFLTHVRTHDNALHACAFCPRKFTDAQKWEEHSAEHIEKIGRGESVEKPYSCEYCKKSFEYQSVLKTHIRMHTGERPYECPECKKKLKTQSALTEHVNGHKRPYPCPECKQRFGKRNSLSRHMLLHTGERPHSCTGCPMTFVQRSSMLQHMRRFHEPGLKRAPKSKKGAKKTNKKNDC
ncbi:zinc finger protein 184-like [Cydia amplana]|uniref:zinc finger protein 184-like n=1 Tax=Cydia amplana TaxID=1869771 RepID=UPI002FE6048C